MDTTTWLAYAGVITALIIIPGPSSVLITLHGYKYGFKKTHSTIIGNLIGSLVLMGLSAIGLSLILTSSQLLFSLVKYIGAAYLIFIGIRTWLSTSPESHNRFQKNYSAPSPFLLFKQGLLTGISNPKDLLFFTALFPAFLSSAGSLAIQLSILMITWLFVDYAIKVLYLLAGKKINTQFSRPHFSTIFNRLTGALFVTFGIILAGSVKA